MQGVLMVTLKEKVLVEKAEFYLVMFLIELPKKIRTTNS